MIIIVRFWQLLHMLYQLTVYIAGMTLHQNNRSIYIICVNQNYISTVYYKFPNFYLWSQEKGDLKQGYILKVKCHLLAGGSQFEVVKDSHIY